MIVVKMSEVNNYGRSEQIRLCEMWYGDRDCIELPDVVENLGTVAALSLIECAYRYSGAITLMLADIIRPCIHVTGASIRAQLGARLIALRRYGLMLQGGRFYEAEDMYANLPDVEWLENISPISPSYQTYEAIRFAFTGEISKTIEKALDILGHTQGVRSHIRDAVMMAARHGQPDEPLRTISTKQPEGAL